MMRTVAPYRKLGLREFFVRRISRWPFATSSLKGTALIVAGALTAIVFLTLGAEVRGTVVALQVTARWSFLLFWLAYAGAPMAKLWGPRFDGIARQGRELGLAFASAQLVHVGLVFWLFHISDGLSDRMLFFWVGILCTYLLALLSFIQFRNLHAPRIWWWFRTIATEYIAFVFALDFILDPIRSQGLGNYPWTYLPFAVMLIGGASLRLATYIGYRKFPIKTTS